MIRTVGEWLPRAVDDGTDLEARSRMLLAAHYAGVGQQSGTGVGAVHAIGHAIGTRGRLPHGTALATVMPEVFETYLGVRDRELALVAVALGVADPRDDEASAARAGIDAVEALLERVGQRRTLAAQGLGPETHETIAQDAIEDAAINNSPRLPSNRTRSSGSSPRSAVEPAVRRRTVDGRRAVRASRPRSARLGSPRLGQRRLRRRDAGHDPVV